MRWYNWMVFGVFCFAANGADAATYMQNQSVSISVFAAGPSPAGQDAVKGHRNVSDPTADLHQGGTDTTDNSMIIKADFSSLPSDAHVTQLIISTGHENWSGTNSSTRTIYLLDASYAVATGDDVDDIEPTGNDLDLNLGSTVRWSSQGSFGQDEPDWPNDVLRPNLADQNYIAIYTTAGEDTDCDFDDVTVSAYYYKDYGMDLDHDEDVDSADFLIFASHWTGVQTNGTKRAYEGDGDGDGDVDSVDYLQFISEWTGTGNPPPPPQ